MAQQTNQQLKAERKNLINEILADNLHGKKIYLLGSAAVSYTHLTLPTKLEV